MSKGVRGFIVGVAALGLAACATASAPGTQQGDRVIASSDAGVIHDYDQGVHKTVKLDNPRDSIMLALRSIYTEMGIEPKLQNPTTGEVGNADFVKYSSLGGQPLHTFVSCGSTMTGPAADSYRVQMSLVSYVTADGAGSQVQTRLAARAADQATSKGWISCLTTGVLEERVNQLLVKILNQ